MNLYVSNLPKMIQPSLGFGPDVSPSAWKSRDFGKIMGLASTWREKLPFICQKILKGPELPI